ncbi:MAG TPA: tRNA preQ1(34) S-adenosylmethionine ribosyltransferase-isomerase QueA [Anaerolineales bacterium]|nr:tRNA preQ1(34) S-adenosylmethionine ribosyltransferase-isomerase QueA [Anaerolineales bacterium]
MRTSDFEYELPESSIAQTPVEPRDSSRLLVLHRDTGGLEHRIFREIIDYLHPGDLLVLNQTRVIPARIYARKETGGRVELLLLRRRDELTWEALVRGKGLSTGKKMFLESDYSRRRDEEETSTSGSVAVWAEVIEVLDGSERVIRFSEPIELYFSRVGNVPLPPYIHEQLGDPERYQTVYAREPGSAAAPTAGLHFTERLLEQVQARGVKTAYVTLHVGLDTFAPVTEEDPREHKIHSEWCQLPRAAADLINQTRQAHGRVIAVGTTSVRTLESAALGPNGVLSYIGATSLLIVPGYEFRVVDAMITNFHLPRSTLIMLVSAFAGRERILSVYETAIKEGYRFYSFGDAMLII